MRIVILALALWLVAPHVRAQVERIVTAKLDRYSIAALVMHAEGEKAFKHGIALFPGHPGIMKLREENGQPEYDQRGNFLIRSRRHWLDEETLVAVIDAPSDQWATFLQDFRSTPRYGADVAKILGEVGQRYAVSEWTLVGTSEGSISAFHAARMNPQLAKRVILTSSLFSSTPNGRGLSNAKFEELAVPLLWVHHEDDPCQYTSYSQAKRYAERTRAPLVTVRGGGPEKGGACQAFTAHGFVGVERNAVLAMRSWVKTGAVPPDVAP
jgi:predicted alpha/beta hydrolase family esterase